MRKRLSTILILLLFLGGISLMLYPTVSEYVNSRNQSRAITLYSEEVAALSEEEQQALLAAAHEYNEMVATKGAPWLFSEDDLAEYNSVLDTDSSGVMGYVNIPRINVSLPIYHGTGDTVLQKGVGHLEGSSLPVGGESTHAVLSSHRGLVSARLFTDLDQMEVDDVFTITVLGETLTYQVDQILVVLPTELEALNIEQGQDYCTLLTCTPYGVNTHRLLVRGHRIANLISDDVETVNLEVTETERTPLERMQQLVPYIIIIAVGLLGLAFILPVRKRRTVDADEETDGGDPYKRWDDDQNGASARRRTRSSRNPRKRRRKRHMTAEDAAWEDRRQALEERRRARAYRETEWFDDDDDYGYGDAYAQQESIKNDSRRGLDTGAGYRDTQARRITVHNDRSRSYEQAWDIDDRNDVPYNDSADDEIEYYDAEDDTWT